MRGDCEWKTVLTQLERCRRAGVIDKYVVRGKDVILTQRRHVHRIPRGDVSTFLSGMIHYACAAGVDRQAEHRPAA